METRLADGVGVYAHRPHNDLGRQTSPGADFDPAGKVSPVQNPVEDEQARRALIYLDYHSYSLEAQEHVRSKRYITDESVEYMSRQLQLRERNLDRQRYGDRDEGE